MVVADRRTIIVLGSLVAAMTLVSTVLLALEPRPVAPTFERTLISTQTTGDPVRGLFQTTPAVDPRRWQAIVIHHSGTEEGSARSINRLHENLNLGGLGYHFVIGNGSATPDGSIELGFRWDRQLVGAHSAGPDADWYNRNAIGICLVGDARKQPPTEAQMRELVWLVRQLQIKFNIPADRVLVQGGDRSSRAGSGRPAGRARGEAQFPLVSFRQQLVTNVVR